MLLYEERTRYYHCRHNLFTLCRQDADGTTIFYLVHWSADEQTDVFKIKVTALQ